MRIDILTLFPEMFVPLKESIIGRAVNHKKIEINLVNIRDFSIDKHKKCDDYPYGGGAGMVMMPQPLASAIEHADAAHNARRIYLSPKGATFSQKMLPRLESYGHIVLVCGHYEGIDQRVIDLYIDEEISLGDFVLTGGELPAMVVADCLARFQGGVLSEGALADESFTGGLLEYPHYTRPQAFGGLAVPEVLVSGDHGKVDAWRKEQALKLTKERRPDLLEEEK
ncbi:MAG: tRNA (guanosine(37)-N1)-methyltransferase TrmD [Bacillota bacterium]|nr:MAG: tRNA (guanosine(37)-N1)-methyltransferase TrmD [Bacillota bacterium]